MNLSAHSAQRYVFRTVRILKNKVFFAAHISYIISKRERPEPHPPFPFFARLISRMRRGEGRKGRGGRFLLSRIQTPRIFDSCGPERLVARKGYFKRSRHSLLSPQRKFCLDFFWGGQVTRIDDVGSRNRNQTLLVRSRLQPVAAFASVLRR